MLKRIFLGLLLVLLVLLALAAAVAVKIWRTPSQQLVVAPAPKLEIDMQAAAMRLAGAIPIRTVSSLDDPAASLAEFDKLHAYLVQQFPKLHATLKKEVVGQRALLYTWAGTDPQSKPIALMAHQDMVPIAPGTEKAWSVDPFAGEIKDGFVMGDDEEVSGRRGALPIAQLLKSLNIVRAGVRQTFPDAIVAPGLMTAATDSRHLSLVSDQVFRFSPFRAKSEDLVRFHDTNERLAVSNYSEMIRFYHQLLRDTAAQPQ